MHPLHAGDRSAWFAPNRPGPNNLMYKGALQRQTIQLVDEGRSKWPGEPPTQARPTTMSRETRVTSPIPDPL